MRSDYPYFHLFIFNNDNCYTPQQQSATTVTQLCTYNPLANPYIKPNVYRSVQKVNAFFFLLLFTEYKISLVVCIIIKKKNSSTYIIN